MKIYPRLLIITLFTLGGMSAGCGKAPKEATEARPNWPDGSGYITAPKNRPTSPHDVEPMTGGNIIVGVSDNGRPITAMYGFLDIRNNQVVTFHPGQTVTHDYKEKTTLEVPDYNGDKCVFFYGTTARIDEYGQYVFVKHSPDDLTAAD